MESVTQKDIAQKLGVDESTVSLSLRNSEKISKEKRNLIQQTAIDLGYRPNASAINLSKHRKDRFDTPILASLAWLNCWPDPKALYQAKEFTLYYKGAIETAKRYGYKVEEFVATDECSLSRIEQIIYARGIKGIFVPPHPKGVQFDFHNFDWGKFSVVRFGRSVNYPCAHIYTADQFGNMLLTYDEIEKRGYHRIGMINVRREFSTWVSFDSGYLRAQEIRDIQERIPIYYEYPEDTELNHSLFNKWIEQYQPDAIISATTGATNLIKGAGLKVGKEIGLATTTVLDTTITAGIQQNSYEIGHIAARNLISQIHEGEVGMPKISHQTFVPGIWVDGDTLPRRT